MSYKSSLKKDSKKQDKSHKKNMAHRVLHSMEIPPEVLGNVSALTMWGNNYVRVENHKGILELLPERITLSTEDGSISFNGDKLLLELMEGNVIRIRGTVKTIEYNN